MSWPHLPPYPGNPIATRFPMARGVPSASPMQNFQYKNLFVACLPRFINNDELTALFSAFDPVRATIMMDVATGRSKGFGFVLFNNEEDGYNAMQQLNGRKVSLTSAAFTLHISPSVHDGFSACCESPCVYFRNIPSTVPRDVIVEHFTKYGSIVRCEMRPATGELRNLLMIEFDTIEGARRAICKTHGQRIFAECTIPVMAKFAESNEEKNRRRQRKNCAFPQRTSPPKYDEIFPGTQDSENSSECGSPHQPTFYRHDPYTPNGFVAIF